MGRAHLDGYSTRVSSLSVLFFGKDVINSNLGDFPKDCCIGDSGICSGCVGKMGWFEGKSAWFVYQHGHGRPLSLSTLALSVLVPTPCYPGLLFFFHKSSSHRGCREHYTTNCCYYLCQRPRAYRSACSSAPARRAAPARLWEPSELAACSPTALASSRYHYRSLSRQRAGFVRGGSGAAVGSETGRLAPKQFVGMRQRVNRRIVE